MHRKLFLSLALATAVAAQADKRPLDHSVYDDWKSIPSNALSADGRYAVYQVKPQQGDAELVVEELRSGRRISVARGEDALFDRGGRYLLCRVKPLYAETRAAKIKKKKGDDLPQDSLAIVDLTTGAVEKVANLGGYALGADASRLIAFSAKLPAPTAKDSAASDSIKTSKKRVDKKKSERSLIVRDLATGRCDTLPRVGSFTVSRDGTTVAAVADADSAKHKLVYRLSASTKRGFESVAEGARYYGRPVISKADNRIAFTASADTSELHTRRCVLMSIAPSEAKAVCLVDSTAAGMPQGWSVGEAGEVSFSKSGDRVFFGIAPMRQLKDTTLVDFETARLDIWHYQDPLVQPMQLKRRDQELKRSFKAVADVTAAGKLRPLGDERLKTVVLPEEGESRYALGIDITPYELSTQWLASGVRMDVYSIDTQTGERRLLRQGLDGSPKLSSTGRYAAWYDVDARGYFAADMASGTVRPLTEGIGVVLDDEDNDVPAAAREYGMAGWTDGDRALIVYDRFDLWQLDPSGKAKPLCLTKGAGRADSTQLRLLRLDPDKKTIAPGERQLLASFNTVDKRRGLYALLPAKQKVEALVVDTFSFDKVEKAKLSDVYLYQKGNFTTSNDLYVTSDRWKSERRLSDINPQQAEYLWGRPELYRWTTFSGKPAEGVVYKPENFDPAKKYPVLIYYYERVSDRLYSYSAPAPSRSIINIPFYTSRGYVVFTPDIRYTTGEPGPSAYDYIVSGAQALADSAWVNKDKIGLQGQSWGGYQTAYLITQTDMFAAAGAGAPVSNMTSAYGGIRWATGMSRQYQYEKTQSRIGKTLWDEGGLELYIKNSPVFFADKVTTPLLIMHNDNDGAVPWYQGIEYFMALRRLGKEVWMLQYNNEEHNLVERRNTQDLVRRLQQFFDHYLKDEPMPAWMKTGVPATRKGMEFGFEF